MDRNELANLNIADLLFHPPADQRRFAQVITHSELVDQRAQIAHLRRAVSCPLRMLDCNSNAEAVNIAAFAPPSSDSAMQSRLFFRSQLRDLARGINVIMGARSWGSFPQGFKRLFGWARVTVQNNQFDLFPFAKSRGL